MYLRQCFLFIFLYFYLFSHLFIYFYIVVLGNTAREVVRNLHPAGVKKWNVTHYQHYLQNALGPLKVADVGKVASFYPPMAGLGPQNPASQLASIITDMRAICGTDYKFMVAAINSSQPLYRYIVEDLKDNTPAFAGLDAAAYFDAFDAVELTHSEAAIEFQRELREVVWGFVRTGRIPSWGKFPNHTNLLNAKDKAVVEHYHRDQCEFWRLNAMFPTYARIN